MVPLTSATVVRSSRACAVTVWVFGLVFVSVTVRVIVSPGTSFDTFTSAPAADLSLDRARWAVTNWFPGLSVVAVKLAAVWSASTVTPMNRSATRATTT